MKKLIAALLTIAMLLVAVCAFAQENTQEGTGTNGMQPGQLQGRPERGQRPGGGRMPGGMPQMPSGEKPADLPEMPSGDEPADLPEMPSGEKPADLPQMPSGDKPADLPQNSTDGTDDNSAVPEDQTPVPADAPALLDLNALVANGVISQETCEKIQAYMQQHAPAMSTQPASPDATASAEAPAMNEEAPDAGALLDELLEAGIITEAEYTAMANA